MDSIFLSIVAVDQFPETIILLAIKRGFVDSFLAAIKG
jgi:hypothetical protein